MSLLRRVCAWLAFPSRSSTPDTAPAEERHAEAQVETVKVLRAALHGRQVDNQLREAREELDRAKARVAVLDLRAAVRGREES